MASVDNLWITVKFFGLALLFVTLMIGWNVLSSEANDLWEGSSKGLQIKANAQNAVNQFDYILLFVYFGFHLGILVTAYLLRTYPVVYIAALFVIGILALIAAPLSNAWEDMADNEDMTTAMSSMPKVNYVMDNLPKFEIIWGFITAIVMFGLAKSEDVL